MKYELPPKTRKYLIPAICIPIGIYIIINTIQEVTRAFTILNQTQ